MAEQEQDAATNRAADAPDEGKTPGHTARTHSASARETAIATKLGSSAHPHGYTLSGRVRYSEIDHTGVLTLPALIDYFQDACTFQAEAIGEGMKKLKREQRAWVLSSWQIHVHRYPALYEPIVVGTFATGFRGMFGSRNFYLTDVDGAMLAVADSLWVFTNLATGRPVRPDPAHLAAYGTEAALPMPHEERRIQEPAALTDGAPFSVLPHDIDTNEHVNNGQYVRMALDVAPDRGPIRHLRANYQRPARLGDVLLPRVALEETRTVVELCPVSGGKADCLIELRYEA